jgi:hypothetical protein
MLKNKIKKKQLKKQKKISQSKLTFQNLDDETKII